MPLVIKTALALTLAPIAGGMVGLLIYLFHANIFYPTSPLADGFFETLTFGTTAGALYGGMLGIIPSFLVGWPLHMVLQRAGLQQWWAYIVLGVILATVAGLLVAPVFGLNVIEFGLGIMLMMAGSGAIGGIVFWLIRRPDRDPIASPPPEHPIR